MKLPQSRVLSCIFWESWRRNFPERALVAGLLMMAISGPTLVVALLLRRHSEFATVN